MCVDSWNLQYKFFKYPNNVTPYFQSNHLQDVPYLIQLQVYLLNQPYVLPRVSIVELCTMR